MKKIRNKVITESVLTTVFLGLLIYSAYSLWYIFYGAESGIDVHLYTILSGVAIGWDLLLLVQELFKKAGLIKKLVAFVFGNAFFQGLIWGLNKEYNFTARDNEVVIIKTFTVAFVISALSLLVTFILRARKGFKPLNIILAAIFFVISAGGAIVINEENIKAIDYKKNIQFDRIQAQEIALSYDEKQFSEQWYSDNLADAQSVYPFTFKLDGEQFKPEEWEKELTDASEEIYQGGKTQYLTFKNKEKALEVTVEMTSFKENASCQWTVYIKNNGTENSGVITDFYAIDHAFATGEAELYYSMGSDTAAADFSLIKKALSGKARVFSGSEGKPTEKYLPYFNINGESCSMVLGIGWTGQWEASLSEADGKTEISVKQQKLEAYLLPGEEIRSPLVSFTFYNDDNALKGFNAFRKWIMDCVYPESVTKKHYTVMEVAGPMSVRTSDEILEILNGFDKGVFEETDAFWMDAGWYSYNEGWYDGVGNWTVDTSRYDNGISELSSYAVERGMGHVLWYEPERVFQGTIFYNKGSENDQWLIYGEDNNMWNLANEDALSYYCEYILNSLKENGVTVYRQDFNFAPLEYWEKADREYYGSRTGICENHYVTNLYKFLDYLCDNIDGLIIDNCASGGKRLDLEMTYRSIPFWRSDYNCDIHSDLFEATQSQTYGISFWLPITGTALNMTNEYSSRSGMLPLMLMDFYSHTHPDFSFYHEQRDLMTGNYYPLDFGSFDKNKMHAMQYSSDDGSEGVVLIYKRAHVNKTEYTARLNGLVSSETYNVYDIDNPETVYSLSGEELMNEGITVSLPDGEKAMFLMYASE